MAFNGISSRYTTLEEVFHTSMNEILTTAGDAQVLGHDRVVPLAGHAPQVLRAVRRAQDRRRVLLLFQHHGRR